MLLEDGAFMVYFLELASCVCSQVANFVDIAFVILDSIFIEIWLILRIKFKRVLEGFLKSC